MTNLLSTGSYNVLDRLFAGEKNSPVTKKRKLDEPKAPFKPLTSANEENTMNIADNMDLEHQGDNAKQ